METILPLNELPPHRIVMYAVMLSEGIDEDKALRGANVMSDNFANSYLAIGFTHCKLASRPWSTDELPVPA